MSPELSWHPDRLFPSEPTVRDVARRLYEGVRDLPIISPHGHVPPQWIADDVPFTDPVSLLLTPDHYINRMLHADGVPLERLGVPPGSRVLSDAEARAAWREFCVRWPLFRGTPMRYWMSAVLVDVFGLRMRPSAETADAIYDGIAAALDDPSFRPRALMERFDIAFMATTDDPCDDLEHHEKLAVDPSFTRRVVPTFRPDRYLEPARPEWRALMTKLGRASGIDTDTWAGWIQAMENRRAYFKEHGAVSSDHAHLDAETKPLTYANASRVYLKALAGEATESECKALQQTMLFEQARMAADDGLTMTLHPATYRNHHTPTFRAFGPDVGCDIPISVEFTRALHPLLNAFGTNPNFTLVVFTMDETVYSRELAPLAGFYPSVYVGVPWWFIDAPDAIRRFRKAVSETAGFSRTSGFIDDTRAFLSIPARHDMSRRLDAVHLAELVAEHRLDEDEAAETIHDLVAVNPRKVFHLD
ncbi:MAG: glucuronate isomerase [Propionibacteriaceae bacterium]|jgi:glucuronate isomerase|nr:glucuronate isomerase [Propionibacteriaceae bacterium]